MSPLRASPPSGCHGRVAVLVLLLAAGSPAAELAPDLMVGTSLRGIADGVAEVGEPVRVAVRLALATRDPARSLVLAPPGRAWTEAVTVELLDAAGGPTGVEASVLGVPEVPEATLTRGRSAAGLWLFAPGASGSLPPGEYRVRATLAIPPGGQGWHGTVRSEDTLLGIVAPSSEPRRVARRALSLAHHAMLQGDLAGAAAGLDRLLADHPGSLEAWTLRAAACERAGNLLGAHFCLGKAMALHASLGLRHPPAELLAMQRRVLRTHPRPPPESTPPPALPAWSWPPGLLDATPTALRQALAAAPAPSPTPTASPPVDSPAATPAAASPVPTPPASHGPPAATPALPAVDAAEAGYLADVAAGRAQWAVRAEASSAYGGKGSYDASQAVGPPDVPRYADHPRAWCPSSSASRLEWLELGFDPPRRATAVRVRQTHVPGTLVRVEGFFTDGSSSILWEGRDPAGLERKEITWFEARFPRTELPVERVRLTLDTRLSPGWKQVDAVQLVGE